MTCRYPCLSIWIHGIVGHPIILRDIPLDTKCSSIYNLVSQISGVPSEILTLSNGVKILECRKPMYSYVASPVNLSHGLNLHCYIKHLGGDSEDEGGEKPHS